MSGTSSWNRTLTDRQRVLLHTQPLMLMRYHWLSRDDDGQRYDPLCLWIKLFEVVIDQSGFGNDAVREPVARELIPLLRAVDAANRIAPDETRYRRVVDRRIGHLLNDSNRGESFSIDYTDFDADGQSGQYTLTFKLLKEVHGYTGEIALELSAEAINQFLNKLIWRIGVLSDFGRQRALCGHPQDLNRVFHQSSPSGLGRILSNIRDRYLEKRGAFATPLGTDAVMGRLSFVVQVRNRRWNMRLPSANCRTCSASPTCTWPARMSR